MALRYFPSAQFVLLEPQESMRPHLDELCRETPNVRWLNVAAGESAGMSSINICEDPTHSSLLTRAGSAKEDDRRVATQSVRILSLQEACGEVPALVKVDTEGFELQVLKGCASLMGRTEIFLLELALTPLWDGSASLTDVVRHMAAHGYQVFDIVDKVSTRADGFTRQVDVAFCRNNSRLLQPA